MASQIYSASFLFRALLDSRELSAPVALEPAGPVVHRLNLIGVGAVERLPSMAAHHYQTDVVKHAQVLRHGRLRETKGKNDVADGSFAWREVLQDVSSPRLGDRIEEVGGRRGTRHDRIIFL